MLFGKGEVGTAAEAVAGQHFTPKIHPAGRGGTERPAAQNLSTVL